MYSAITSVAVCWIRAEVYVRVVRCEFADDDFLGIDVEAYMASSAFVPRVSLAVVVVYNISSEDIEVELLIVSLSTDQVI